MNIVYEDKDQIVIHKPAGVATQTARLGEKDLISEVKNHIARSSGGNNPYVAVINRLDQPVEGIVLFAKNAKAAAVLSSQMQDGSMEKYYLAAIYGNMDTTEDTLVDYLQKDGKTNTSKVVLANAKDAKKAILEYTVEATTENMQLVRIHLLTGRHHQIRVQFSNRKHPLIGDTKYGTELSKAFTRECNVRVPALCAYKLLWKHPVTGKDMEINVEPENAVIQELRKCK